MHFMCFFYIIINRKRPKQDKTPRMVPVPELHISDYTETKIIFLLSILAEASCTEILKKKKILLKIGFRGRGPSHHSHFAYFNISRDKHSYLKAHGCQKRI